MNDRPVGTPWPQDDDGGRFTAPGFDPSSDQNSNVHQTSRYTPPSDPWVRNQSNEQHAPYSNDHVMGNSSFPASEAQETNIWDPHNQGTSTFGTSPAYTAQNVQASPSSTRKSKKGVGWGTVLISVVISVVLSVGGVLLLLRANNVNIGGGGSTSSSTATPRTTLGSPKAPANTPSAGTNSPNWVQIAAQVSPATVTILSEGSQGSEAGSGVIYDAAGHVVTNHHVVAMAEGSRDGKIVITLSDGRVFPAEPVGIDKSTDLAVIKIKDPPKDLAVASFGTSSNLSVGQGVMAIGAPLGLSSTVTTGIVSAIDRPVEVESPASPKSVDPNDPFGMLPRDDDSGKQSDPVVTNAIQVDASINPGNSGGPLFDTNGHVIGINFSIASLSSGAPGSQAGSIGLGFAIPSDLVKSVADQILKNGSADHGVLGVQLAMKPGIAQVDGAYRTGAAIAAVEPGSAAAQAGIKPKDVVISVDGSPVTSGKSLSGYIRRYTGGSTVKIQIIRDAKVLDLSVELKSKKQ